MEVKENPIRINRERNGCHVTVNTFKNTNEIKFLLEKFADEVSDVFVPAEILWDGASYSFYVRHRQSLKEYLCRYEITIKEFQKLFSRIAKILIVINKMKIPKEAFVFDYDCVFIGKSFETLEFVYAPGAYNSENFTGISDLLTVIAIHIKYDNEKEESTVKNIIQNVIEWEKGNNDNYFVTETSNILSVNAKKYATGTLKSWYPFVLFQITAVVSFIMFLLLGLFNDKNYFIWILVCIFIICVDYLLIPKKNKSNNNLYLKDNNKLSSKLIAINDEVILIGRDEKKSTVYIPNIFVSRKHVEVYKKDNQYFIKDLFSTNGTYLENCRIYPNVEYILHNKSKIMLGTSDIKFTIQNLKT